MAENENKETSSPSTPKPNTKKKEKETDTINALMSCMKPIFFLENIFGIFRFSVTADRFAAVSTRAKISGIITAFVITIAFGCLMETPHIISRIVIAYGRDAIVYGIVTIVDEVPSIAVMIQYLTAVISTLFLLGDQTTKIFETFVKLDLNLRLNINENFYSRCRLRTIQYLIILIMVHLLVSTFDLGTDEEFAFRKILTMTLYLEQDLEIFAFCKMIMMVAGRLKVVNEYLEKFVQEKDKEKTLIYIISEKESKNSQINFIGQISSTNMKIRDLASMYDTIGNVCYMINEVFKFQIFMNLAFTFTFVIITIWTTLYYVRSPEISGAVALMTAASWCVLTILSVAVMSFTCESLLSARSNTKLFVNEIIMDYDLPRTMRLQAKVFMELIEAWPLRIFVYDMFSIDIKLMLKFVSVATTYLIVIIQISHFV